MKFCRQLKPNPYVLLPNAHTVFITPCRSLDLLLLSLNSPSTKVTTFVQESEMMIEIDMV